jgi:hypothetical protein
MEATIEVKKTDGELFKEYLASLDRETGWKIKKRIIEACYVEYPTLDNWRYGICRIPPLAKEKIEETIGMKIFNEIN